MAILVDKDEDKVLFAHLKMVVSSGRIFMIERSCHTALVNATQTGIGSKVPSMASRLL